MDNIWKGTVLSIERHRSNGSALSIDVSHWCGEKTPKSSIVIFSISDAVAARIRAGDVVSIGIVVEGSNGE